MTPLLAHIHQLASLGGWATVAAIVLLSYLLEDAALIMAAVLAGGGAISPWLAWGAAFFGIFTGDIGVYLLARHWRRPGFARWRGSWQPSLRELVLCRFTPGLRTVSYGWCGLSGMPLSRFARIVFSSGLVWTLAIFGLIYLVGAQGEHWLGLYRWLVLPIVATWLLWRRAHQLPAALQKESLGHE